jgi:DNA (cytosine-5)-methyltransferase 1
MLATKTAGRGVPSFRFVDLFAGIGGFHAALSALGGHCVYASEIDPDAARVYHDNWGVQPGGDIVEATTGRMDVPEHEVLAAGFPCQPFSKSGYQRGMDEARGTLFWNICRVLEERKPRVVLLENVRNLAGPRHAHEWDVIVRSLREIGYRVSSTPAVFSPHLLPPHLGGRPQVRERVFVAATYIGGPQDVDVPPVVVNRPVDGWDPQQWDIQRHLPLDPELSTRENISVRLTGAEVEWIDAWDDFCQTLRRDGAIRLPGFPVWADHFVLPKKLVLDGVPAWKADFLRKNALLYATHRRAIDSWFKRWGNLDHFPPSRRKLEWQAQDTKSLWETVMHFRPSGIRAKRATYVPALVAITQTSVYGPGRRRITVREAARLQGLPDSFEFGEQRDPLTYKQLGNGVNVGAAYHVLRKHILENQGLLRASPELLRAVRAAPANPDETLQPPKKLTAGAV